MSEYRFFLLHKILVLSVNVLVLVALTIAMYLASLNPEEFTLEFLKAFGGMQGVLNRIIYQGHLAGSHGGLCVACGACLKKCPQKIDIVAWLRTVHEEMMRKPTAGH